MFVFIHKRNALEPSIKAYTNNAASKLFLLHTKN